MGRRKRGGWFGHPRLHAKAVRKGLRRKGRGYVDYKPSRSKRAWARDRATKSRSQEWETPFHPL